MGLINGFGSFTLPKNRIICWFHHFRYAYVCVCGSKSIALIHNINAWNVDRKSLKKFWIIITFFYFHIFFFNILNLYRMNTYCVFIECQTFHQLNYTNFILCVNNSLIFKSMEKCDIDFDQWQRDFDKFVIHQKIKSSLNKLKKMYHFIVISDNDNDGTFIIEFSLISCISINFK